MIINTDKIEISISAGLEYTTQQFLTGLRKNVMEMTNAGMSIDNIKEVLRKNADEGTGVFGIFKNNLKSVVASNINEAANQATYAEYENAGITKYRWVTMSKQPCPDCIIRHGQIETMETWEQLGLPKSGFSVCQDNCKCKLLPVEYKGEGLDQPIIRKPKSPKELAYESYQNTNIEEYIAKVTATAIPENIAIQKSKKYSNFAGDMAFNERVDWVLKNPDAVYFRLHTGKKQLIFVREEHYVFYLDEKFQTALVPDPDNIEKFRYERRYKWIRILDDKWKTIK